MPPLVAEDEGRMFAAFRTGLAARSRARLAHFGHRPLRHRPELGDLPEEPLALFVRRDSMYFHDGMYILLHTCRQHKKERPYSLKNHKPKTLAPPRH